MTQRVAPTTNLNPVAAAPTASDVIPDLWTEVHEQVQGELALLENEVRRKVADVRVDKGRTKGDRFYLCTYKTLSTPGSGLDPAVSGITFTPAQSGVVVESDVSGEQRGDFISPASSTTVANSRQQLLAAAVASARHLCQSADAIIAALGDQSRRVE
jgi:hypothetical protein